MSHAPCSRLHHEPLPPWFFFNAYQDKEDLKGFEDEIEDPRRKDMANDLDASRLLEQNASLMAELDSKNGERMSVADLAFTPRRNASAAITARKISRTFDGVFAFRSLAASFLPTIEIELVDIEPDKRRRGVANSPGYLRSPCPPFWVLCCPRAYRGP